MIKGGGVERGLQSCIVTAKRLRDEIGLHEALGRIST